MKILQRKRLVRSTPLSTRVAPTPGIRADVQYFLLCCVRVTCTDSPIRRSLAAFHESFAFPRRASSELELTYASRCRFLSRARSRSPERHLLLRTRRWRRGNGLSSSRRACDQQPPLRPLLFVSSASASASASVAREPAELQLVASSLLTSALCPRPGFTIALLLAFYS